MFVTSNELSYKTKRSLNQIRASISKGFNEYVICKLSSLLLCELGWPDPAFNHHHSKPSAAEAAVVSFGLSGWAGFCTAAIRGHQLMAFRTLFSRTPHRWHYLVIFVVAIKYSLFDLFKGLYSVFSALKSPKFSIA